MRLLRPHTLALMVKTYDFQRFILKIISLCSNYPQDLLWPCWSAPISNTSAWKEVQLLCGELTCPQTIGNCLYFPSVVIEIVIKCLKASPKAAWCVPEGEKRTFRFQISEMKYLGYETQDVKCVFRDHIQEAIKTVVCGDSSEGIKNSD